MEHRGFRSLNPFLLKFIQLGEGRECVQTQCHVQTIDQQCSKVSIWQSPSSSDFQFSEGGARLQSSWNLPQHQGHLVTRDEIGKKKKPRLQYFIFSKK